MRIKEREPDLYITFEPVAKLRIEEMEIAFDQDLFPYQNYDFRKVQLEFFDHFMRGILTEKGLEEYIKLKS